MGWKWLIFCPQGNWLAISKEAIGFPFCGGSDRASEEGQSGQGIKVSDGRNR
jgi:hypothetical protein